MKKFLSATALALATALTLGGCSAVTPPPSAPAATATATPAVPAALAPYQLEYYMLCGQPSSDAAAISAEVSKILQPKFNATVNISMLTYDEWFTKINPALSAGAQIDVMLTADWWQYTTSVANNYFLPLNDLMEKYARETMDQLGEVFIKGSQFKGVNYAVPTDKELATNGGFVYNKTLADKYNMTIDPTWKHIQDWEPLLKIIQENEPDIVPFLVDGAYYWLNFVDFLPAHISFDGNANDLVARTLIDFPEYEAEMRAVRDLYLAGYIPKDTIGAKTNNWMGDHFNKGNFFLTSQPLKPGKGKSNEMMAQLVDKTVTYDEFETFPLMGTTGLCGGSMLAIPVTSRDPDRAMMFINEMHVNPDVTNLLAWGIEGKNYTVVSENPKRVRQIEGNTWTQNVLVWTLGNVYNVYLSDTEPEDKYVQLAATKQGVIQHAANGFRFDVEPYQDQVTALQSIWEEFEVPLRIGALDIDQGLADLRRQLDAAGYQTVLGAVTADLEQWAKETK